MQGPDLPHAAQSRFPVRASMESRLLAYSSSAPSYVAHGSSGGKIAFDYADDGKSDIDFHISGRVLHSEEAFLSPPWGCKSTRRFVNRHCIIHRIPVFTQSQLSSRSRSHLANGIQHGKNGHWDYQRVLGYVPTAESSGWCTLRFNQELRCESYSVIREASY